MYTTEEWKEIAAEERSERCMSPQYSPAVARRTHLHPSDPDYLPPYDEEECPDCGGTGVIEVPIEYDRHGRRLN